MLGHYPSYVTKDMKATAETAFTRTNGMALEDFSDIS
jgi:hypothetical protein